MHRSVKDPSFSFEGGCIIFTVITTQLHNSIIAVERSARGLDKSKIIIIVGSVYFYIHR